MEFTHDDGVARRRPAPGRARNARQGMLDSLLEGAGDLVQSVANEVVPGVVGALDVDELVQRVDVQALLDRVDVDVLLDRIDVDALLARVDIDALLARTEFGAVISRSGSAVAGRALDVVRSQGVGVDAFIDRWVSRLLRRTELPAP
jgi:hypothetical protein